MATQFPSPYPILFRVQIFYMATFPSPFLSSCDEYVFPSPCPSCSRFLIQFFRCQFCRSFRRYMSSSLNSVAILCFFSSETQTEESKFNLKFQLFKSLLSKLKAKIKHKLIQCILKSRFIINMKALMSFHL